MTGFFKKHLWLWLMGGMFTWAAETFFISATCARMKSFRSVFWQLDFLDALLLIHTPRDMWVDLAVYMAAAIVAGGAIAAIHLILKHIFAYRGNGEVSDNGYFSEITALHAGCYVFVFLSAITLSMTTLLIRPNPRNHHYFLVTSLFLLICSLVGIAVGRNVRRAGKHGAAKLHAIGWILCVNGGIFLFLPLVQYRYGLNWRGRSWLDLTLFLAGWLAACGGAIGFIGQRMRIARFFEKRAATAAIFCAAAVVTALTGLTIASKPEHKAMTRFLAREGSNKASKIRGFLPEPEMGEQWEEEWKKRVNPTRPADEMPNIILVVVDTLRADGLGAYAPGKQTPFFDKMAREGVVFERAYSASPWTVGGHASMFTGTYPSIHGANYETLRLADGIPTLAKTLGWAGYESVGLSTNCWLNYQTNLNSGFDFFMNSCGYGQIKKLNKAIEKNKKKPLWKNFQRVLTDRLLKQLNVGAHRKKEKKPKKEHWIQEAFEEWHERRGHKPFFLFVNYINPHSPYFYDKEFQPDIPPGVDVKKLKRTVSSPMKYMSGMERLNGEEMAALRGLYDASVTTADNLVRKLIGYLDEKGELDNTIMIFTADHGEYIGEHGQLNHFFGVYNPAIKVPLIIRYPRALKAGTRVSEPVQTTDLFLTLLDLTGIKYDHGGRVLGKNLLPIIKGKRRNGPIIAEIMNNGIGLDRLRKVKPPEEVVDKYSGRWYTLLDKNYQYVYSANKDAGKLYKLDSNGAEGADVTDEEPEIAREMKSYIQKWIETAKKLRLFSENDAKTSVQDLSDETRQQLKALGYIDN